MSGQYSSTYANSHCVTEGCAAVDPPTTGLPKLDIASLWVFPGTNNSALRYSPVDQYIPADFNWSKSYTNSQAQKRHWTSEDSGYKEDDPPPSKVHINEEKVAMQFNNMSLHPSEQDEFQTSTSSSAIWKRYHQLEHRLEQESIDVDTDEGVDMGLDMNENPSVVVENSGSRQTPSLYLSPEIENSIAEPVPQIIVPKPCSEVVLWKPSGVDFLIKDTDLPPTHVVASGGGPETGEGTRETGSGSTNNLTVVDCMKASRKKKSAVRSLSANSTRLIVPMEKRPNTPPPNNKTAAISGDIAVCFVDDPSAKPVEDANNMEL